MPFAVTWMELEILILSDISHKEKDKYHYITYLWNLKYGTNEPIHKTEIDSQTKKTNLWLPEGKGAGRDKLGVWD